MGSRKERMMSLLKEKEKLEQQRGRAVSQTEWADAVGLREKEDN